MKRTNKLYREALPLNTSQGYKMGLWAAEYRLTPWSHGYKSDFDFRHAAETTFNDEHPTYQKNISDYMQAVEDVQAEITLRVKLDALVEREDSIRKVNPR